MHYRWEGTDNEGIIRSLSWRLYQVGIRWWSAAPGFGKFAFAERRAPRANLRPSAATILSPMWRSPTLGSGPRVGRDVGKGATRARYFPPILVVRPYFFFFLNPLKRRRISLLESLDRGRGKVFAAAFIFVPIVVATRPVPSVYLTGRQLVDPRDKCNLIISDGFKRGVYLRTNFLLPRM